MKYYYNNVILLLFIRAHVRVLGLTNASWG
jgi:hypothetical protein